MSVFLSHSRQYGSAALKLQEQLGSRGVKVWLDLRELDPGEDWNRQVADAIAAADGFIVIVGAEPDPSQRFEWAQLTDREIYLDASKPLVPVVFGSAEIPGFLRTRKIISAPRSGIDFDALAAQIAEALGKPEGTIDPEQLERGRAAREAAMRNLERYSFDLSEAELKRAGLHGLK